MVFRKLTSAFAAGVTVDTVLSQSHVAPGGTLRGEVRFNGGSGDHHVQGVGLEFTAVVDLGSGAKKTFDFHSVDAAGAFALPAGAAHSVPLSVELPWETPVSALAGQRLTGMELGVATTLRLKSAVDKGDLDPLNVEPTATQSRVLQAIDRLGFAFHRADLEAGALSGSALPFHQKIEYWAAGEFRGTFSALQLAFVTDARATRVVLDADRAGGFSAADGPTQVELTVAHDDAADLVPAVHQKLSELAKRRE
ncbi:MAG TPA: sporulation protein [Stackebrandtia sp.]|jgi:sporulation-control protein|uniref:sporulation protein n=1 Tax=Stackebrandtia sp. TaxID=2023065 RepID=UPI002D3A68B7|nr:sporulation protein [Stackebrandtia sp.]HZE38701.1 sporulation protein [Stackebrandtia sp.]